jgi:hypothetical protein
MRRAALAIPVLSIALAGCAASDPNAARSTRVDLPPGAGPFAAVELRIHPLTRVVDNPAPAQTPGPQIEAHIELLDSYGAVVRDVGVLRFELYRGLPGADPESAPASATQELNWTLDLSDPGRSARQFDRITQTYVVPLPGAPDWIFGDAPATLRVEFTTPDDRRIVATRRLRVD